MTYKSRLGDTCRDGRPRYKPSERIMARRRARDQRDGLKNLTHEDGLCGMEVAACCGACYADEREEMLAWAENAPGANPGEEPFAYWRRIDGAYYDPWHDVAHEMVRRANLVKEKAEAVRNHEQAEDTGHLSGQMHLRGED